MQICINKSGTQPISFFPGGKVLNSLRTERLMTERLMTERLITERLITERLITERLMWLNA